MGVTDWRVTAGVITGLSAKESIVSTLDMLLGTTAITTIMSSFAAFCLLLFILLYMPCVATFAAMRRELKSTSMAIGFMLGQTLIAYVIATIVFQIGSLF